MVGEALALSVQDLSPSTDTPDHLSPSHLEKQKGYAWWSLKGSYDRLSGIQEALELLVNGLQLHS